MRWMDAWSLRGGGLGDGGMMEGMDEVRVSWSAGGRVVSELAERCWCQ
jgi:hypothetical protein